MIEHEQEPLSPEPPRSPGTPPLSAKLEVALSAEHPEAAAGRGIIEDATIEPPD
ncbi:hypothetical protein [Amycolatopsis magusensis]|uniref:hypothetical protein n=1 Tax=Amycolatopsis magusensis TaxID=882444 RepID=UPI003C2F379A